jgi:hypothetical protein
MKTLIATFKIFHFEINKVFLLKTFSVALITVAIIAVKISCIKTGYEISRINNELTDIQIKTEILKKKEYEILNVVNLNEKAKSLNMDFIDIEKTFYVK